MDVSNYRRQVEAEVSAASDQPREQDVAAAGQALSDTTRTDRARLAGLTVISGELGQHPELLTPAFNVFRDTSESRELRLAALRLIQQASFQFASFAANRPLYLETLRAVVDDPDAEVRRGAIGALARERDEYVQRRLLEGLQDPSKALVPPAKAIQYLGYDVHADYFPVLRQIVAHPPDETSQREAVRLLGADPSSRDVLSQLVRDRNAPADVRHMSALALNSVAPDEFNQVARDVVMNDSEDDGLRTTFVSALTHFGDADTLRGDRELTSHVERLSGGPTTSHLQHASARFVEKVQPQQPAPPQ